MDEPIWPTYTYVMQDPAFVGMTRDDFDITDHRCGLLHVSIDGDVLTATVRSVKWERADRIVFETIVAKIGHMPTGDRWEVRGGEHPQDPWVAAALAEAARS